MNSASRALTFTDAELAMLGKTADALSAYMGTAILAEIGETDGVQWVIFGRALDAEEHVAEDIVHVQIGGRGTNVLGQRGGLQTHQSAYDCAFLWAIEITDDEDERFVRLNPDGEVFDAAPELAMLLPFTLEEPDVPADDGLESADDPNDDDLDILDPDSNPGATRH